MKTLLHCITASSLLSGLGFSEETISYLNVIRQYQEPSKVQWDASKDVAPVGSDPSELEINPGGARFELWTFKSSSVTGITEYQLASSYVGAYIPVAKLEIISEDTAAPVLRTRADRPFKVNTTVSELLSGKDDPEASKSVKFLRYVQSYGENGTGEKLDRTKAQELPLTLPAPMPEGVINQNGTVSLAFDYPHEEIPGTDLSKLRGEVTFTVKTQPDDRNGYHIASTNLDSKTIQIWPVADGSIKGITANQSIRFSLPTVTLALNDLYPSSTTYAQVYQGEPVLGTTGKIVPGSAIVVNDSVPQNKVLTLNDYDSVFTSSGRWTMELVTATPFGIDRLDYVTFDVDRTIKVNSAITTIDKK